MTSAITQVKEGKCQTNSVEHYKFSVAKYYELMTKMSVIFYRTVTKTHIPKRHHDFENPITGKMFDNTQDRIYGEQNQ